MTKKKSISPQPEPAKVFCSDCRRFVRDTSGISRNNETGEYFMGLCAKGLTPDGCKKVFANKPRLCLKYMAKPNDNKETNKE